MPIPTTLSRTAALALVSGAILGAHPAPASASGPLADFAGTWKGRGSIAMTDGSREGIRCKGTYAVNDAGDAMNIHVACASDSYRIDLAADVAVQGGSLSGQWRETTRGVQGSVSGQVARPGMMLASLEGTGFGIQLSARASGRRQVVAVRPEGTDIQSVDITLKR